LLKNFFGNEEKGDLSTKVCVNKKYKINDSYGCWVLSNWANDPFISLKWE
jgi:hypothetical protein